MDSYVTELKKTLDKSCKFSDRNNSLIRDQCRVKTGLLRNPKPLKSDQHFCRTSVKHNGFWLKKFRLSDENVRRPSDRLPKIFFLLLYMKNRVKVHETDIYYSYFTEHFYLRITPDGRRTNHISRQSRSHSPRFSVEELKSYGNDKTGNSLANHGKVSTSGFK